MVCSIGCCSTVWITASSPTRPSSGREGKARPRSHWAAASATETITAAAAAGAVVVAVVVVVVVAVMGRRVRWDGTTRLRANNRQRLYRRPPDGLPPRLLHRQQHGPPLRGRCRRPASLGPGLGLGPVQEVREGREKGVAPPS